MIINSFEKMLNKGIHTILKGHMVFNMYQKIIDFGFKVKYHVVHMSLKIKDEYASYECYHGMI